MQYRTFSSLYGFRIRYPDAWGQNFGLGQVQFSPVGQNDEPSSLIISAVQTNSPSTTALANQIHRALSQINGAELLSEQVIQLDDLTAYSCSARYGASVLTCDDLSESVPRRAFVMALPLYDGKVTILMTFTSDLDLFPEFDRKHVQPVLNSFRLEEDSRPPAEGYRRIARDEYGIAIDFPENWLTTGFDWQRIAFRSLDQRWQIDNITLVTSQPEDIHSLRDYCALARLSFKSDPSVEIVDEYKSTLDGVPSYSIEYTILDRLGVLNQGKQTVGVTQNGLMVNLTTLAPKDKLDEYDQTFQAVYQSLTIRPG